MECISHIEGEGRIPTTMTAHKLTVDPDFRFMVHRSKTEMHSQILCILFIRDKTRIPEDGMIGQVGYVGGSTLIDKRHYNLPASKVRSLIPSFHLASVFIVKGKVPHTIQILPLGTLEIGSRIFCSACVAHFLDSFASAMIFLYGGRRNTRYALGPKTQTLP